VCSSSITTSPGMSPARIEQKMQSSATSASLSLGAPSLARATASRSA
jgi:hypothetical protein